MTAVVNPTAFVVYFLKISNNITNTIDKKESCCYNIFVISTKNEVTTWQ